MISFCLTSAIDINEKDRFSYIENCIERISSSNKEAFKDLFSLCKGAVYGYALSILKNKEDAEDVLQDTFINIFRNAGNYKKNGRPMPWILTIAKNLSLMKIRDRQKFDYSLNDEWDSLQFASFDEIENSEMKFYLNDILSILNDEERTIVILHASGGLKHREIAELTNMKISTVLSKYNRALKKIKEKMGESRNEK